MNSYEVNEDFYRPQSPTPNQEQTNSPVFQLNVDENEIENQPSPEPVKTPENITVNVEKKDEEVVGSAEDGEITEIKEDIPNEQDQVGGNDVIVVKKL